MKIECKVYTDGYYYYANLPRSLSPRGPNKPSKYSKEKVSLFNKYFTEAQKAKVGKGKILEYVEDRIREECDISEWLIDDEGKDLLKRNINNQHKRIKRYERKIFMNQWNWFVTFTYDSKKETEESFAARLRKTLSNCATRRGWRYIGVAERGSNTDRLHYHFIMNIPDGEMIGELYLDCKYSKKRRKMEYFTNNTYFQDRFGQSCWEAISESDLRDGSVKEYLLKYLCKSEGNLIYSRGIPMELECSIDTERDVICSFTQYSPKMLLNWASRILVLAEKRDARRLVIDREDMPEWDLDEPIKVP